jgi:hypothetical protein
MEEMITRSENINELAVALSKAQAEFQPAKMNAVNPFLKNHYADLGSVIEAQKSACAKNGLSVAQPASTDGLSVMVTTLLMHSSGQWISSEMTLPLGDEKGRSLAQAAGSIITYLRRYSLSAMLGIYADEDTDGNEAKAAHKIEAADNGHKPDEPIARPYAPEIVRQGIVARSSKKKNFQPTDKQVQLLRYGLNLLFEDDPETEDERHTLLKYLAGDTSTNNVNGAMFKAIVEDWLKMKQDEQTGEYTIDPMAIKEARKILEVALVGEGQLGLPVAA